MPWTPWARKLASKSPVLMRLGHDAMYRHQDMAMYFRHREDHYGVGNYLLEKGNIADYVPELQRRAETSR